MGRRSGDSKKGGGLLRQKPGVIYAFIEEHRHEFRVAKMCKVLGVSRGGYYEWRNRAQCSQKQRKASIVEAIKEIFVQSRKTYGSPRITMELYKQGLTVTQKTVSTYMREYGLRPKSASKKGKKTTDSNHHQPIYPNLLKRDFHTEQPGETWVADITYIWTREGWLYLASVMDLFSRKVIGWNISHRLTKELATTALHRAMRLQPPQEGLIHHSDRGSQYASHDYQAILREHGMRTSMSRKGDCYDNACIESFHATIEKDLLAHETYDTREEAKMSVWEYIACFYNEERTHSTIGYVSPNQFERQYRQAQGGDTTA
ncbi:IS3 family transposase [Salicibibacter cibi]|uniref:IS3 family transposase n=1 Tax=Salicibibacter cibi TaxID=2743001 RepID=A0A7T6ZEK2_9BACI|nr:IS3 family transposase [Salicibibacter cibi]QQK81927.1 IS3 family transposase [Salicibibacter cibi]QQK81984.1 IS3 family transposase [Salicibibacter cibi]QQK82063.1 IS3 family transposase [Salicibibacter cibi]